MKKKFWTKIPKNGHCVMCGQFLYPERGQKQTLFDPLPPHLVHVVINGPLLGNGFTLAISTYMCQYNFLPKYIPYKYYKRLFFKRNRSQFVLHSFLSTGLLGNGFTLAVLWRSPRLYNCCTPYLISMTICDLLASLLILPLLGRVH